MLAKVPLPVLPSLLIHCFWACLWSMKMVVNVWSVPCNCVRQLMSVCTVYPRINVGSNKCWSLLQVGGRLEIWQINTWSLIKLKCLASATSRGLAPNRYFYLLKSLQLLMFKFLYRYGGHLQHLSLIASLIAVLVSHPWISTVQFLSQT